MDREKTGDYVTQKELLISDRDLRKDFSNEIKSVQLELTHQDGKIDNLTLDVRDIKKDLGYMTKTKEKLEANKKAALGWLVSILLAVLGILKGLAPYLAELAGK